MNLVIHSVQLPLQLSGQSTGLVNQGSRVQFSPEAFYNQQYILIFTINIDCISTFILVIRQTIPPYDKIQYGQSLNHAVVKINNSSPQFTTINCFFHFYLKISLNLFQKEESSQNCFCSSRTRGFVQFNKDQEFICLKRLYCHYKTVFFHFGLKVHFKIHQVTNKVQLPLQLSGQSTGLVYQGYRVQSSAEAFS